MSSSLDYWTSFSLFFGWTPILTILVTSWTYATWVKMAKNIVLTNKICLNCKLVIAGNSKGLFFLIEDFIFVSILRTDFKKKCEKVKFAKWKTNIFLPPKKDA